MIGPGIFHPGSRSLALRDKASVPMYCVEHYLDDENVEVWFNPTTDQIVKAFFWIEAIKEWADVTDYVLHPDNRRLYDTYLIEVIKLRQEIEQEQIEMKNLAKGIDLPY